MNKTTKSLETPASLPYSVQPKAAASASEAAFNAVLQNDLTNL